VSYIYVNLASLYVAILSVQSAVGYISVASAEGLLSYVNEAIVGKQ
jgi:hypothetical protein